MPSRFESELAPPAELLPRIRDAVAATPAPRTGPRARIAAAMAVVPFLAGAVLLMASQLVYERPALRPDLEADPTSPLLMVLLLVVGLTVTATLAAAGRGAHGHGLGVPALFLVAVLVTPIYAALTFAMPLEADATIAALLPELSPWGLRCLSIAAAAGVPVLVCLTSALRRSAPAASRLRGAALGAAAGSWAGLSVFVFCPAIEAPHLVVGHVLPIAALTLLGLAFTPRALRP